MRAYDLIMKKRNGEKLTEQEIKFIIENYAEGKIPDYQMSAWLMAVWFNKLDGEERAVLTEAMLNSGNKLDLSSIQKPKVDKHSTGGVGDGISLALTPIVAAAGGIIPMMSGRGLGHTGGTLDKLESIPGFKVMFTEQEILDILNNVGCLIMGQTDGIVPADKKMYALRDVTATVDSVDLIAGSIMSKKLAEGMDSLMLDVKTGKGAFMQKYEDSVILAKAMLEIGVNLGKNTIALISDMNQPLGSAVGNSLEMIQAIEVLKGNGPKDFSELVKIESAYMLISANISDNYEDSRKIVDEMISTGKALQKLKDMIKAQGGNENCVDDYSIFPQASEMIEVKSEKTGYISDINAMDIGIAGLMLGAGRETKDSELDYAVGLKILKKVGDKVEAGNIIAELYVNDKSKLNEVIKKVQTAYEYSENKVNVPPLIYSLITKNGIEKLNIQRP